MVDETESMKRLEMHVKRVTQVSVAAEPTPDARPTNMSSSDTGYIGSMLGEEDAFPTGMRRRVMEAPLGSKIGYHELEDDKEDADEEWMIGEASQISGSGAAGSRNWVLKVLLPLLLIVGVICMHNWWMDIKKHASKAINAVGDVFDRRALLETEGGDGGQHWQREEGGVSAAGEKAGAVFVPGGGLGLGVGVEGRQKGLPDKAVYSVGLGEDQDQSRIAENDRA